MSEQQGLVSVTYDPWYQVECVVVCGWTVGGTGNSLRAKDTARQHVRETGHETAVKRESSVHWKRR